MAFVAAIACSLARIAEVGGTGAARTVSITLSAESATGCSVSGRPISGAIAASGARSARTSRLEWLGWGRSGPAAVGHALNGRAHRCHGPGWNPRFTIDADGCSGRVHARQRGMPIGKRLASAAICAAIGPTRGHGSRQ